MTDNNPPMYDEQGRRIIEHEPQDTGERIAVSTGKPDQRKNNKPPKPKAHRATEDRKKQVQAMAAYGIQHHIIADIIGICKQTLYNHYRDELATAKGKATAAIAGKVYQQAMQGCTKSQRLYLSTQAGWNNTLEIDQRTVVAQIDGSKDVKDAEYTDAEEGARAYREMIANLE